MPVYLLNIQRFHLMCTDNSTFALDVSCLPSIRWLLTARTPMSADYSPFVLDVDVAAQMRLVVTAHLEHHDTTASAKLGVDVLVELLVRIVRLALLVLQRQICHEFHMDNKRQ